MRNPNAAVNRLAGVDVITAKTENTIQVYTSMNQFLTSFLEKQLPSLASFVLQDRTYFEFLLDVEFPDTSQTGIFYRSVHNMRSFYKKYCLRLVYGAMGQYKSWLSVCGFLRNAKHMRNAKPYGNWESYNLGVIRIFKTKSEGYTGGNVLPKSKKMLLSISKCII